MHGSGSQQVDRHGQICQEVARVTNDSTGRSDIMRSSVLRSRVGWLTSCSRPCM